jgi:hypothetical protein
MGVLNFLGGIMDIKYRVLLVGGFDSVTKELSKKLNPYGIVIKEHWVNKKDIKTAVVPATCNGVIILKDICSHHLFNAGKEAAAKSGLKWCASVRKWSLMELDLRATGFLGEDSALSPETIREFGGSPVEKLLDRATKQENKDQVKHVLTEAVKAEFGKEAVMNKAKIVESPKVVESQKTRAQLLEDLKKTLNELFVEHHVASVNATAEGIKIRVMEELNLPM